MAGIPTDNPCFLLASCTIHLFFKATAQQHSECASLAQHPPAACHAHALRGRHDPHTLHPSENTTARNEALSPLLQLRSNLKFLCHGLQLFQPDLSYYCRANGIHKGLKPKSHKKTPPIKSRNHCHQNLVILAEGRVQAIIQLQADEEKMALLQSTF